MDETAAMQRMIDDLRRMRNSCEPKSNENPRYLRYSNAISALLWLIENIDREGSESASAGDHWETGPAVLVSAPKDYPKPGPGPVTTWALRTPEGEPVGTLRFNQAGVEWTFAAGVSVHAQEHGLEIQEYLRGHCAEEIDLTDTLDGIRDAYAGDLTES